MLAMCNEEFLDLITAIKIIRHGSSPQATEYLNSFVIGRFRAQNDTLTKDLECQTDLQSTYVNISHPDFAKYDIIGRKVLFRASSIN